MTFAELKSRLTDRNGVAVDSAVAGRIVNDAADRVAMAANWKELEFESAVTFTNGQPTVTLGADVRQVVSVRDSNGRPLEEKSRDAWDDLYEGDATTAATPLAFCEYGGNAQGTIILKLWPIPNATTQGTCRGLRRLTPMSNDADVPALPPDLHHLIAKEAIALYREYEESELAVVTRQDADAATGRAVAAKTGDVLMDKT